MESENKKLDPTLLREMGQETVTQAEAALRTLVDNMEVGMDPGFVGVTHFDAYGMQAAQRVAALQAATLALQNNPDQATYLEAVRVLAAGKVPGPSDNDYAMLYDTIQKLLGRIEELETQVAATPTPAVWRRVKDSPPPAGPLVKRWKNGAVWAGRYSGAEKETSFDSYLVLPELNEPPKGNTPPIQQDSSQP